jgi:2-polyprenyl-3-methyl-5-hydroxy-6-metoxy-1,4-benzoquinol methylase
MKEGNNFLDSLMQVAQVMGVKAKELCDANDDLCSWLLDPLAKWSKAAYGESIFMDADKGYAEYCINVARAQAIYEKNGKYTQELLSKIKDTVYNDEKYMVPYMWAAILIYAYWPSMVSHIAFFRDEFLNNLRSGSRVLELACGHGVMGLLAAEHRKDITVDGLDISEHAIGIANKLRNASGYQDRVRFEVKDALNLQTASEGGTYNGIIAAMLAEHLQEPQILLDIIKHHLAPDGIVYFSTALESFQKDHVYEFNNESEPILMAEKAGLRVQKLISCDTKNTGRKQKFNPRALATLLTHR